MRKIYYLISPKWKTHFVLNSVSCEIEWRELKSGCKFYSPEIQKSEIDRGEMAYR